MVRQSTFYTSAGRLATGFQARPFPITQAARKSRANATITTNSSHTHTCRTPNPHKATERNQDGQKTNDEKKQGQQQPNRIHFPPPKQPQPTVSSKQCRAVQALRSLLKVRRPLDAPDNVIPLGKKGHPVVERRLLLVGQVLPVGADVLGLGRRLAQRARGVLAGEDCKPEKGLVG